MTTGMAQRDRRISQMKAIREPAMRSAKMAETLRGDCEDVVIFLHRLLKRSGGPGEPNAEVLDALLVALGGDAVPYQHRASLYAAAIDRADIVVARLFIDGGAGPGASEDIDELAAARPVAPRGRPLSLGERKSLARGPRNELLLHLLRDPHPDVVEILLGNPHIIEADILTVAARRPTLARNQQLILASHRWRARYRVKRALVLNPYSPPAIGVRLTMCLSDSDLRMVAGDTHLAMRVRQQARGLLDLRREPR